MARAGEDEIDRTCGIYRHISDSHIKLHPKYVAGAGYYDVAVVHLEKRFPFNRFIKPICLPVSNASNLDGHKYHSMRLAGRYNEAYLFHVDPCFPKYVFHRMGII